jgi:LPXTG-site transpeptidase (sortase) family protein
LSVLALVALAGCASASDVSREATSGVAATRDVAATPAPLGQPSVVATPLSRRSAVGVASVEIPRVGIRAKLVPLRLGGRSLEGPEQPDDVGWYADSPLPGDRGAAVLVGHVDSRSGPAVFARLGDLRAGDLVLVRRTDGPVRFRVLDVARYRRSAVPLRDVYGPTPDRALRLITCDGPYRKGSGYRDNVVVYALAE